jgi:hypothetical protein
MRWKRLRENGRRRAPADETFRLEYLNVSCAEPLGFRVEQPAKGTAETIGLKRLFQEIGLQQHRQAGERALRGGSRSQRCNGGPDVLLDVRRDGNAFPGR